MPKPRIMIVEDDAIVALEIKDSIESMDYTITSVSNSGEKAIQRASLDNPNLVLMDIRLKGQMDGIEAARRIRAEAEIPVVFLTAYADETRLNRAKMALPFGYVLKPFEEKDLKVAIEMALYAARIDNERKTALEKLQWEASVNSILAEVSKELISSGYQIKKLEKLILERSRSLTQSEQGFISTIDPKTGLNTSQTYAEMMAGGGESHGKYPSVWGQVLQKLDSCYQNNPSSVPDATGMSGSQVFPERFLFMQVKIEGKLAGQIVLANSKEKYTDQDLRAIEQLSELYAIAIHRQQFEKEREEMQVQVQRTQKLEAIGTLAGGIAHDFNNILHPIMGYAQLCLKKTSENEAVQGYLTNLLKAADRAKELVQQILSFSRTNEPELKPLRIQSIIKEALMLLRSSLPSTIEIKKRIDENCGLVVADAVQVHQIIMNLGTNAYHSMQTTGGQLSVALDSVEIKAGNSISPDLKPGTYVCLSVADSGTGMKQETINRIFDPYFTTKVEGKGTGLGLAVVLGIVKKHGGGISVTSQLGKGSEFKVYLPQNQLETKPVIAEINETDLTGSERILLVDDESAIIQLQTETLGQLGYHVTAKTSSLEALQVLKSDPDSFDLVISDMTMPEMTGDKLAEEILRIKPGMPIIIYTGYSELINEQKAKALGIKEFLLKPITQNKLALTIRKAMDG